MDGIIVGYDGSEPAFEALEWAISEAALRRTPVTVVTVVQRPQMLGTSLAPMIVQPDSEDLQIARGLAEEAVAKATAAHPDLQVTVRAVVGIPAAELLHAAEGAQQLVVGSRGAGGFSRLLLGSVSSQVVHHAACPVTVIRTRRHRD